MKRRSFLSMITGALAAPALPTLPAAPLANAAASGSKSLAFARALFHSRTRYHLSARDLAAKARIPEDHAQRLITRLLDEGHITRGNTPGVYTTATPIGPAQMPQLKQAEPQRSTAKTAADQPDINAMMQHLRAMADNYFAAKATI